MPLSRIVMLIGRPMVRDEFEKEETNAQIAVLRVCGPVDPHHRGPSLPEWGFFTLHGLLYLGYRVFTF